MPFSFTVDTKALYAIDYTAKYFLLDLLYANSLERFNILEIKTAIVKDYKGCKIIENQGLSDCVIYDKQVSAIHLY